MTSRSRYLSNLQLSILLLASFGCLIPVWGIQDALAQSPQSNAQQSLSAEALNLAGLSSEEKSRAYNKEGANLLSQGKSREAAEMFRKAITVNPQGAAAHNNLALVLKEMGNLIEAEKEARLALKLKADKASYHFNLGLILQRQNKHAEAEPCFREALKIDPMDPEAHYRLALSLSALSKPAEAEEEAKLAILMKPNEASYHRVLADCLLQEKKYDASLCEYRTTVELDPQGHDVGDIRNKIDYLKQVLNVR
ncbi:MAG: tetratricopeptide repeat protein [Candidatus Obscuribacterales bacterium]|jgi:tetratricopeptide (TPR) repeat protein|nr:tetratricopeptide repeat protein [Candidatus Obscuribacterales bacterium]